MNTQNLEYRIEELAYWCEEFKKTNDNELAGYIYGHAVLLLDELEGKA